VNGVNRMAARVSAVAAGAAVGYRTAAGILPATTSGAVLGIPLGILAGLAAFMLASWVLRRFAPRRLADRTPLERRLWLATCLVGGLLVVAVVPVRPPGYPLGPMQELEIVATGEKHPDARGSEVWLQRVQRSDGSAIEPRAFTFDGAWELRDGVPLSYQDQPARLRWRGRLRADPTLVFVSHPWSGVVEVTFNGATQRIDLYAKEADALQLTLSARKAWRPMVVGWQALATAADAVTAGLLLLLGSVWLATRRHGPVGAPPRWAPLVYGGVCAGAWFFGLLVFWPGLMSGDSLQQWWEMTRWRLGDDHPAFHTAMNWVITRIWRSPAAIATFQIVALAWVVGWGLTRMRRAGMPRWLAVLTCAGLALSPVNMKLVITLWKDIPFAISFLALMVMMLQVVLTDGAWLGRPLRWLGLGVLAALVALFRHNGAPGAAAVLGLSLIPAWRRWWWGVLAIAVSVGVFFGVRGPLYKALGVKQVKSVAHYGRSAAGALNESQAQLLGAHVQAGTPLADEERALLERAGSLETWADIYNPFRMDWSLVKPRIKWKVLRAEGEAFRSLLTHLNERNPWVLARHYYWRTNFVWRIEYPEPTWYSTALADFDGPDSVLTIMPNKQKLKPSPVWPGFDVRYARWLKWWTGDWRFELHWRPALQLWLFLAGALVAAGRSRDWRYLLLFAPLAAHSFFVAWLAPSQDFRYQYPVYLTGMLFAPFLLFCARTTPTPRKHRRHEEASPNAGPAAREPGQVEDPPQTAPQQQQA
jgi:hypothetical protein